MSARKARTTIRKPYYAGELEAEEIRLYKRVREESPAEEIALLRIMIRRMLRTLNSVKSFQETIQTANAISYLTGRIAKLFEVQEEGNPEDDEFARAYLIALREMIEKKRSENKQAKEE